MQTPTKIGKYFVLFHRGIKFYAKTERGVIQKALSHKY